MLAIVIALDLVAAPLAKAQAALRPAPLQRDTTVHRLALDPTHIQAATFTYRVALTRDTVTSPIGDQRFVVTLLDYAGTPALMLARDGMEGVSATSDSLIVRRSDLRALHWTVVHGLARVAAEFTADSIFGAMSSPLGKQNVVMANPPDVLVNAMDVDAVLASLPLANGWRDSASVLVVDAGGAASAPATLAVEGEERVTVPAGDFDCWIVSLETERGSERVWVTKQGQIVVRAEQVLPDLAGAVITRVLVQSDTPALMPASAKLPH
ncbi:MAG: hypothetical protein DMD26_02235 [Gemmatimonadetes bacterium]|nr:MAG: hypothetical protein DMD26_02235 [Gemmatimonadota bacterium]